MIKKDNLSLRKLSDTIQSTMKLLLCGNPFTELLSQGNISGQRYLSQ